MPCAIASTYLLLVASVGSIGSSNTLIVVSRESSSWVKNALLTTSLFATGFKTPLSICPGKFTVLLVPTIVSTSMFKLSANDSSLFAAAKSAELNVVLVNPITWPNWSISVDLTNPNSVLIKLVAPFAVSLCVIVTLAVSMLLFETIIPSPP